MTGANQHYTQRITFTSNVQNLFSSRDLELYELVKASGIVIDPPLFRVLLELLRMDVSPTALYDVLHNMATQASNPSLVQKKNTQNKTSGTSHVTERKKPPVAAKPKKIRVENSNFPC